ncbi:MAG: glycosyltransferase family 2 protein [Cypionkella sp.]
MQVSCLIPAYNEASRIADVLTCVLGHPLISEVIVVDDASSDGTSAVVAAIGGAKLITLTQNGGKTAALAEGIAAAQGEVLLLVDADLVGLSAQDLTALLEPVLQGWADVSISLRRNAPRLWQWIGLDYISGERALRRSLIAPELANLRQLPKFGFEVFLNGLMVQNHARIAVVEWPGVISPLKGAKYGWAKGIRADFGMIRDMVRVHSLPRLLRQILRMRQLRV